MTDSTYERLLKLAEAGDASVAFELIEAAKRHGDDEAEARGIALALEQAKNLPELRDVLRALLPMVSEPDALRPPQVPTFGGETPILRKEPILSWDEGSVLGLRQDKLELMERFAWLSSYVTTAKNLTDLENRLDDVWGVVHFKSPHFKPLMELMHSLPTFGGRPPARSDYWVLSYDRREVLVSPGYNPDDYRIVHSREDYESGYE